MVIRVWLMLLMMGSAHAEPFAQADATAGEKLVKSHCIQCHAAHFDDPGDGSSLYLRPNHKVKTSSGLLTQVRTCNTNLGLSWFDEDELNVARYLNQTYYHFND